MAEARDELAELLARIAHRALEPGWTPGEADSDA